jgi:hypothetical protein
MPIQKKSLISKTKSTKAPASIKRAKAAKPLSNSALSNVALSMRVAKTPFSKTAI